MFRSKNAFKIWDANWDVNHKKDKKFPIQKQTT